MGMFAFYLRIYEGDGF